MTWKLLHYQLLENIQYIYIENVNTDIQNAHNEQHKYVLQMYLFSG